MKSPVLYFELYFDDWNNKLVGNFERISKQIFKLFFQFSYPSFFTGGLAVTLDFRLVNLLTVFQAIDLLLMIFYYSSSLFVVS